jgi:hypothetical protein
MKKFLVLTSGTWKDYDTINEIRDDWYFELTSETEEVKVLIENKYGDYTPHPLVSNLCDLNIWTKAIIDREQENCRVI